MTKWILPAALAAFGIVAFVAAGMDLTRASVRSTSDPSIERGRYLVLIGGCNDCHTPDYVARDGEVPEARWLVGDALGRTGPWGTTYPTNLRRYFSEMDEDTWVDHARTLKTRPPMPWFNLRVFTESDLRALYRYVRSLPADDTRVPDYVPPGQQPRTPHVIMTPRLPDQRK